ncbi:Bestrophin, RFP-TM, chloride channel [Nesidiocoris tenuis]|uniref:Bestrophin homolog n=1 Tax=Nesidiocoris tenuis TaxID=355587 RepID=A0ABN7B8K4_9HEMI|nr:Bestrophin, RFP-TM, chloride channel [Nesidiocoris tenuis]
MTVSYSRLVANGSSFGCFWSILFKWRGSVYKLVWRELLVYLMLYYAINFTYRYGMTVDQQRRFEELKDYFVKHLENIPMAFVLAFYVTLVVKRWWEQYRLLPWPDTLALFVSAAIPGVDERGRLMRRNIVRYAVLAYVITLKHVSVRVKKRFPTLQHIVDAGLMMESEKKIVEMMDQRSPMAKYWMPLVWATNIINRARKDQLISSDHVVQTLLMELSEHRRKLGSIISYDTVCIPLVYTQVVTLSVYIYFMSSLIGRQFVENRLDRKDEYDFYFPLFTVLQFCFYIGWLKVAEVLIGPFGEDDDDIELNWLIDRHVKAAYMIVDEMHEEHPELLKDQYWDEVVPKDLPYTIASEHYRRHEPKGSAEFYKVKESDAIYANLSTHRKSLHDDLYADYESVDTPVIERRKNNNWFQRQMQRMGSVRSASTAYSSGGFFRGQPRTRGNSVYGTTPDAVIVEGGSNENGQPNGSAQGTGFAAHPPHKMSIYDRFMRRKSTRRGSKGALPGKLNVSAIPPNLRNRPRIPTPDVAKEAAITDKETNKPIFPTNNNNNNMITTVANSVVNDFPVVASTVSTLVNQSPSDFPPIVQVMLSPIQELDGNQSTITSTGSTAALAQAVLSPTLSSAGLSLQPVIQPVCVLNANLPSNAVVSVTMPQQMFNTLLTTTSASSPSPQHSPKVTELPSDDRNDSACGSSSGSTASNDDRSRKTSVTSQRRGEVYV